MLLIDLRGKISLVTGATGELGRVITRTLAECGSDVIICYNSNVQKAEELKNEATEKYGVNAITAQTNIRSLEDVERMSKIVTNQIGNPDIIVNCAFKGISWGSILEQDIEDYTDQFETIVLHNVAMIKTFVPAMIEKRYGRVIGLNTECAMQCHPTQSAYAAAKRGMDGIYRVLAREIGSYGITVNQVAPGATLSERDRSNGDDGFKGKYASEVPMKRRGTDQEVANTVAFLASDLASFINGVYLPVCGGNIMPAI